MLGRDNRLRAVGQSGFFRKLALRTAADAEVPKGENFPPPRLEPDVVATTPAEPAAAAPLIDLQGRLQLSTFTCTLTFGGREIDIYSPSNWRAEPVERPASVRICNVCVMGNTQPVKQQNSVVRWHSCRIRQRCRRRRHRLSTAEGLSSAAPCNQQRLSSIVFIASRTARP